MMITTLLLRVTKPENRSSAGFSAGLDKTVGNITYVREIDKNNSPRRRQILRQDISETEERTYRWHHKKCKGIR